MSNPTNTPIIPTNTPIQHFNAPTHLPIKLTHQNFHVWRRQLQSALIGYDLLGYIDGSISAPFELLSNKERNPAYSSWFRQDQLILNAILGSCSADIQSSISSANTSHDAWNRLLTIFANKSRSRVISLKEKLIHNPQGSRSISEYVEHIRTTVHNLTLIDSTVNNEDVTLHLLAGLNPEFKDIAAAIRIRETPISLDELQDKLVDAERRTKPTIIEPLEPLPTVNYTQRSSSRIPGSTSYRNMNTSSKGSSFGQNRSSQASRSPQSRHSRLSYGLYC